MDNDSYDELKKRIEIIKNNFYVDQDETDLESVSQQQDFIRAFRLLCHAEFENYIEDIANNLVKNAEEKWCQTQIANYNLSSIFITSHRVNIDEKKKKQETVQTKARRMIHDFKETINGNHGIKESNILKLFGPLGYDINDFDTFFLSELNTFGSDRGIVAHTSASLQTQQLLNFNEEVIRVNRILSGIKEFQEVIESKDED